MAAAAGAFAMALTLLPAGSAQAAYTYLPTKEVGYLYSENDGKWNFWYRVNNSRTYKGSKLISEKNTTIVAFIIEERQL